MSAGPGGEPPSDRLLARERTDLAWTRSSIAFFALGVAVVKFRPLIGLPLLLFSAVGWLINRRPPRRDWDGAHSRRLLLVTLSVTALAVVVAVLTLLGPASQGLRP
ncbi:MAG TPA: DUF202 domain-containing protein [Streptosporangiaceae bacterium]